MDRSVLDLNYGDQSDSDNVEEKGVSGKSKRVRFTEQRKSTKGRGKNFYNEADMFYGKFRNLFVTFKDEDTSESMEGQSAGPVRKNMKHKNQKYDY